jgi:mannosyltransferase OCH1-like enzyme
MESWKKFCSDYEIIEWNEDNFNINNNVYVQQAYEAKKYAFVTDYVRLYVLYTYGGIYMDTDVEVIRPLNEYLIHEAFSGFESPMNVPTGIMASEKGNKIIQEMLEYYDNRTFLKENQLLDLTTNVEIITNFFVQKNLKRNNTFQIIEGFTFYPDHVFCPSLIRLNDKKYMTDAYTIHYFSGSWKSEKTKKRENSLWWKVITVPGVKISKILKFLFGHKYVELKNRIRDRLFQD